MINGFIVLLNNDSGAFANSTRSVIVAAGTYSVIGYAGNVDIILYDNGNFFCFR